MLFNRAQGRVRRRKSKNGWLLASSEGKILAAGMALALCLILLIAAYLAIDPDFSHLLVTITTANMLFGRATGMSIGYAAGMNNLPVVFLNFLIESIQVLIVYPLFVLSWNHLLEIRGLNRFMARMREAAEDRKDAIEKYGVIGLFIFVWIPFWMTGPVVGSIIGYLIGLRPLLNLGVVLGGTFIAILGWAFLLKKLYVWAEEYGPLLPIALIGVFFCVFLARQLRERNRRLRNGGGANQESVQE